MAQINIYGIKEHLLFERVGSQCNRLPNEIEITITETPKHNWGFGFTGCASQMRRAAAERDVRRHHAAP